MISATDLGLTNKLITVGEVNAVTEHNPDISTGCCTCSCFDWLVCEPSGRLSSTLTSELSL